MTGSAWVSGRNSPPALVELLKGGAAMSSEYSVGYGKPPRHTQFKPGCSGNPEGRPPGSKSAKTSLLEFMSTKMPIRIEGKTIMMTRLEAMGVRATVEGLKGKFRPINQYLELVERLERIVAADHGTEPLPFTLKLDEPDFEDDQ